MQHTPNSQEESQSADIETIELPFLHDFPLFIGLFNNLKNASFLRQQLFGGNADFEYAFIDASSVLSVKQVLAAAFRAINDAKNERLKSRNVHAEIVFSFGLNNNITDAFRHFGITDKTTSLLAIKVGTRSEGAVTAQSVAANLKSHVEGQLLPFKDEFLIGISDLPKIRKLYKIGSADGSGKGGRTKPAKPGTVPNGAGDANEGAGMGLTILQERAEMEAVILGLMAMKGS